MTLSSTTKQGFTTYQLKILAVVTMTLDHIYSYLGGSLPIPFWFGLLGRLAAPLFLFCVAKGVYYTHDRAAYCRRLYIAAILMGLGNWLVNHYLTIPHGVTIENHIFSTLFYTVYFLSVLEWLRGRRKDRDTPLQAAALLVLPFLLAAAEHYLPDGWIQTLAGIVVPSPFDVEGGFLWVLAGIGIYYTMEKRSSLALFYLAVCGLFFAGEVSYGFTLKNLFTENYQWFMIIALPFMLQYNEQKGRSSKWFFYLYYPAHIYVLAALAVLLK